MRHDDPLRDDEHELDRTIRRAFADASELDPRGDDDARINAAIARTLQARADEPLSRSSPARTTVYLVAAALCAGALAYAAVQQRNESFPSSGEVSPQQASPSTDEKGGDHGSAPSEEVAVSVTVPEPVTPDSLPSVAPSQARAPTPASATAKPPAHVAETLGPAELFARANDARRANDTTRAIALYEELQSKFPSSREASTSRVALGRLLLDRTGEPARARALFAGYLERDPSGPLAEEARVGRALAAMRLGDRDGERAAWLELLDRHPASVHAERARERLSALGN